MRLSIKYESGGAPDSYRIARRILMPESLQQLQVGNNLPCHLPAHHRIDRFIHKKRRYNLKHAKMSGKKVYAACLPLVAIPIRPGRPTLIGCSPSPSLAIC